MRLHALALPAPVAGGLPLTHGGNGSWVQHQGFPLQSWQPTTYHILMSAVLDGHQWCCQRLDEQAMMQSVGVSVGQPCRFPCAYLSGVDGSGQPRALLELQHPLVPSHIWFLAHGFPGLEIL